MEVMGCKVTSSEYIVGDFFVLSIVVCSGISETFIVGNDTCVSMMESGSLAVVSKDLVTDHKEIEGVVVDGRASVLSVVPKVSGVVALFVSMVISDNFIDVDCAFVSVREKGFCENVVF